MNSSENFFQDILPPSHGYSLSQVRLDVVNPMLAIFKARLNGPEGMPVWARAWLSTEAGTLAESASPQLKAGAEVTLEVAVGGTVTPRFAYMRIESVPLQTEHVVGRRLA
ncbi:MAG TPA: hypothetical protein VNV43_05890 [Candidatus Acidoferrales bacterium]|jgi:hypothetical protein|nr:hypothetical protein [Candidatus Acidoferrales bacterium]